MIFIVQVFYNADVIFEFMRFNHWHPYFSTIKSSKRILRHSQIQLLYHVVVAGTLGRHMEWRPEGIHDPIQAYKLPRQHVPECQYHESTGHHLRTDQPYHLSVLRIPDSCV